MKLYSYLIIIFTFVFLTFIGCKKEEVINPFDDPSNSNPNTTTAETPLPPTSFEGLHESLFTTRCAFSGCHDGSFEPDFRTVESSYNTLVYHATSQKGDSLGFPFRVLPGNVAGSFLYTRLTVDIAAFPGDSNNGEAVMPLYSTLTNQQIENVRLWIEGGAKDIFGNVPSLPNQQPNFAGVVAYLTGDTTSVLLRGNGNKSNWPILVNNASGSIDIWFSLTDDITKASNLTNNKIKFYTLPFGFDSISTEYNLTIMPNPIYETGYNGSTVAYTHRITINPMNFGNIGNTVYFRIYVQDEDHTTPYEMPQDGSSTNLIKKHFAFDIN